MEEEEESHDNRRTYRFIRLRNVELQAVKVTFEGRGSVEYPVVLQGVEFTPIILVPLWRTRHDQESQDHGYVNIFLKPIFAVHNDI